MGQNQKCILKVTWRRSWYDGGGNTMLGTCARRSGTNELDPGSVSVPSHLFFVLGERASRGFLVHVKAILFP